ncbi:MAG: hypothetical protein ACK56I_08935, partial [bacterium]
QPADAVAVQCDGEVVELPVIPRSALLQIVAAIALEALDAAGLAGEGGGGEEARVEVEERARDVVLAPGRIRQIGPGRAGADRFPDEVELMRTDARQHAGEPVVAIAEGCRELAAEEPDPLIQPPVQEKALDIGGLVAEADCRAVRVLLPHRLDMENALDGEVGADVE